MRNKMKALANVFFFISITFVVLASSPPVEGKDAVLVTNEGALRVVTWNMEHLAFPIDTGCRPRTAEEIKALGEYARKLNADIVALQEIGSIEALEQVFPTTEWQLFFSDQPDSEPYECRESGQLSTPQKLAFAVRNGIEVLSRVDLADLGLDDPGLRHGLQLSVSSALGEFQLLNVHLKSGCFVDDFSLANSEACQLFTRQAPILDAWIEEMERAAKPYLVLGDFNHRLSAPYNQLTRLIGANSDGTKSSLINTTADFIGCHPLFPALIDHILVGNLQDPALKFSPQTHLYDDMLPENMLSDHCAVSLTLEYAQLPLSTAVTWQTTSKEYQFLATSTYQRAAELLGNADLPDSPWVVTMDIDETVLDNSDYQIMLDRSGQAYASDTWAAWVASEKARLVPGAAAFIETVTSLGGRIGFITNRKRDQDHHTWRNMRALGLKITSENSCLLGRSSTDTSSVNGQTIINDKDLRRQQLSLGSATCFVAENERRSAFPAATIIMQVGDNIEDFSDVTQESANINAMLPSGNMKYILLPNPMYGSW